MLSKRYDRHDSKIIDTEFDPLSVCERIFHLCARYKRIGSALSYTNI